MTKTLKTLIGAIQLLGWSAAALAQTAAAPLPKEGAYEATLCYNGPATSLAVSDTERYGTYSVTGTKQSANKAFDAMSMECIAAYELRSGVWQHRGYCVFQDPSGDKLYGDDTWTTGGGYKVVFLGGTGKFKGISGQAAVEPIGGSIKPIRAGTLIGCRRFSAAYKLP